MLGLLTKALTNGVSYIRAYLDLELVLHQLIQVYTICNPLFLHMFQRVHLLERSFEFISYHHIPRHLNVVANSFDNYILD